MPALNTLALSTEVKTHLLAGLDPHDRDVILAAATTRHFSAGTVITTQGTPADRLFLLVKGRVRYFYATSEGKKILLIWVGPGEVFGGAALLAQPGPYLVSTEAVRDSEALAWERSTIRGFAERYPRIFDNALSTAAEYIDWYMSAHVALSCHSARERLARVLLGLAHAIGETTGEGIQIDATNEELAGAANITPYTTSRLMSHWQKSRVVIKRRGKILLHSPEGLL